MSEQESLLLDVGNMLGSLVVLGCIFVTYIAIAMIVDGIKQQIKNK